MAVWYEVEKTKEGCDKFLSCNWEFHDFRIERIEYVIGKAMVEVFLKYDSMEEGVLLRFTQVCGIGINTNIDYEADWIFVSVLLLTEKNSLTWIIDDDWGDESMEHLDELKEYATWISSERLFWAVTDKDGNPMEMPKDRIDQGWETCGIKEKEHFELKAFTGNWDDVLQPWYKIRSKEIK